MTFSILGTSLGDLNGLEPLFEEGSDRRALALCWTPGRPSRWPLVVTRGSIAGDTALPEGSCFLPWQQMAGAQSCLGNSLRLHPASVWGQLRIISPPAAGWQRGPSGTLRASACLPPQRSSALTSDYLATLPTTPSQSWAVQNGQGPCSPGSVCLSVSLSHSLTPTGNH